MKAKSRATGASGLASAVPQCVAILLSAPVFEVGQGDPLIQNEYLATLGPDALPYPDEGTFD
jgi:hypothetical protein